MQATQPTPAQLAALQAAGVVLCDYGYSGCMAMHGRRSGMVDPETGYPVPAALVLVPANGADAAGWQVILHAPLTACGTTPEDFEDFAALAPALAWAKQHGAVWPLPALRALCAVFA